MCRCGIARRHTAAPTRGRATGGATPERTVDDLLALTVAYGPSLGSRDIVPLFGALAAGFVAVLAVDYLTLFDVAALDLVLVLVSIGVVVWDASARAAAT